MQVIKPRISSLYNAACEECKAAGVDLSPADYAWLYDAAKRAVESGNDCPVFLEVPITVGNVTLYPRTLRSALWWEKCGSEWYGKERKESQVVALAWSLAHSHDVAIFDKADQKWKADAFILAWTLKLAASVTPAELAWAVDRLFGQVDYVLTGDGKAELLACSSELDWGAFISRLCAAYHRKPEYFFSEISENVLAELAKNAPLPNGMTRQSDADASKRFVEFREVVKAIKSKAAPVVKDNNNG